MILFKACPRCGGDVDTTYHEDSYCVQCAFRPAVVYPGPRVVEPSDDSALTGFGATGAAEQTNPKSMCPKCGSERLVGLDKLRSQDNTCYRCRSCGHIFSPDNRQPLHGAADL